MQKDFQSQSQDSRLNSSESGILNLESGILIPVWFPAAPTRPGRAGNRLCDRSRLRYPRRLSGTSPAMMTDTVADMLTRIRNRVRIELPARRNALLEHSAEGPAQVLKDEGYIWRFRETRHRPRQDPAPPHEVRAQITASGLITRIDRVSKPGCRVYRGYKRSRKPILGGMGIQILSTPKGVISDRRARTEKVTAAKSSRLSTERRIGPMRRPLPWRTQSATIESSGIRTSKRPARDRIESHCGVQRAVGLAASWVALSERMAWSHVPNRSQTGPRAG